MNIIDFCKKVVVQRFGNRFSDDKQVTIVFKEDDYENMRKHLLREDGKERVSYVFFGALGASPIREIYAQRIVNLDDDQYSDQRGHYVVPRMDVLLRIAKQFAGSDVNGLMHIHSHPFAKDPVSPCLNRTEFSAVDDEIPAEAVRFLNDYFISRKVEKSFYFGRMVMGGHERRFDGDLYDGLNARKGLITVIRSVGPKGMQTISNHRCNDFEESFSLDHEILDRNIKLLGEDGQKKLAATKVVLVGTGGAGGFIALNLRGLGLRKITLIDGDSVEKSNLNRLPGANLGDTGSPKVDVIARMIEDVSLDTEVDPIAEHFDINNRKTVDALLSGDIIISAVDSFKTRFEIQLIAAKHLRPLIDVGAGVHMESNTGCVLFMGGQVASYLPGGPCLCCQGVVPRHIDSEMGLEIKKATGYIQGTDITPASVVTINSIISGHAVDNFVKYITGLSRVNPYIRCDVLRNEYQKFNFQKNSQCLICGDEGAEGKGEEFDEVMKCAVENEVYA